MACTSLKVNDKYIQIITLQGENSTGIDVHNCDENFNHTGEADRSADPRDEETYHKELRKAAAEKNQLVTSHSTNPEWNPEGYRLNLDQIKAEENGSN